MENDENISYEPPRELNVHNIVHWSNTYKELLIMGERGIKTNAIRVKARKFLKDKCIKYSKQAKCFCCLPIVGYNSTTYVMKNNKDFKRGFDCSCQFHNKVVSKNPDSGLCCSHVLALKMQLKIWTYNKKASVTVD